MRPPRGLGGSGASVGRSHGEERWKASPCFPTVGGPYVVRTYGTEPFIVYVVRYFDLISS